MLIKDFVSPGKAGSRARESALTRWSRDLVFGQLRRLREGRITVTDSTGSHRFGGNAGLQTSVSVEDFGFYRKVLSGGSLGAAESYMAGEWSTSDLTALCRIMIQNADVMDSMESGWARAGSLASRAFHWLRRNSKSGSRDNIHAHYDLGNDFFRIFLDDTMTYSCGVFETPETPLRDASIAKIDRLCRKLDLGPRDHLIEIGTGWGAFAIHAATRYGCRVTTTTISKEQYEIARERIREAGLENRITLLFEDYRNLRGTHDKLVSVEMVEAVGREFLPDYFGACSKLLAPHGLMALQGIVFTDHRYEDYCKRAEFIQRYVFPGSHLPSVSEMTGVLRRHTDFAVEHLEDLSGHYARTLRIWRGRFWDRIGDVRALGLPEHFIRLWDYYLGYCEAGFLERNCRVVQVLLAKPRARRENLLGVI